MNTKIGGYNLNEQSRYTSKNVFRLCNVLFLIKPSLYSAALPVGSRDSECVSREVRGPAPDPDPVSPSGSLGQPVFQDFEDGLLRTDDIQSLCDPVHHCAVFTDTDTSVDRIYCFGHCCVLYLCNSPAEELRTSVIKMESRLAIGNIFSRYHFMS
ncbi:hypothetical protein SAMN04487771_105012 [[Clostridium] aminophilum]|uniref:Uncharacterized protein n=1 Tax=[Clostridium] aminophilum TaxID=1526 RepID=A0A1I0HGF7_9FIRM|nr:hypothetical protein SAMN04487771_105012 [[Clostridium] aminophilum]